MTVSSQSEGPTDARLTLVTLGAATLSRGGEVVLGPGKSLALVTYLALSPGHTASREFLLDLLWSDLEAERARHALRQALWQLRQTFGDGCFTGREELTLAITIDADRDRFIQAVDAGDLDTAVALYRGEFLPAFALPGSAEFEHWATVERRRLLATFIRGAEMLVRRQLAAGRFREAQQLARRVRAADPLNETTWRLLLEALLAGRDMVQAALEADALRSTLAAERREPDAATEALLLEVRRIHGEVVEESKVSTELFTEMVGREREFSTLIEAWMHARRGAARHVHISSAAGLGKTRLLTDFEKRLKTMRGRVISLRANPGDRTVPYSFAGDLASALGQLPGVATISPASADALVGLSPSLSSRFTAAEASSSGPETLRLRQRALLEAVKAVAEEQPIALLIDDTHWLDAVSHQILVSLLYHLDGAHVLLVTAGRPVDNRSFDRASTTLVALEPLTAPDTETLLTNIGQFRDRELKTALVSTLHRATQGSPLLLRETLQLVLDQHLLFVTDGVWSCPDRNTLIGRLAEGSAVSARLSELPPDTRWLLLVLATAGTPLSASELGQSLRQRDGLDQHLWMLERKGLIRQHGEGWETTHDEIASAMVDLATPTQGAAAHATIGRLLLADARSRRDRIVLAGQHFAAAGDDTGLKLAFRELATLSGRVNDRTSHLALAMTVLDLAAPTERARQLVRTLPFRMRFGLDSPARLGAAAAGLLLALASTGYALWQAAPSEPDALLAVHWTDASGNGVTREIGVDLASWRADQPLNPLRGRVSPLGRGFLDLPPATGPSGQVWVSSGAVDNEYTSEIFWGTGTTSVRLTTSRRDDDAGSLSPDERWVAFSTARWTPEHDDDGDIAVADRADASGARQLTKGPAYDQKPIWSPDGTRIAFWRRHFEGSERDELCWVSFDGHREKCVRSRSYETSQPIAWLDSEHLLVRADTVDRGVLLVLGADDGTERLLTPASVTSATASYDGRWVACQCRFHLNDPSEWVVFPAESPTRHSRVVVPNTNATLAWRFPNPRQLGLDRIVIGHPASTPVVGSSHHLRAFGIGMSGDTVRLSDEVLQWSISDTSLATIDARTGELTPKRAGRVAVSVSAGGWREASTTLETIGTVAREVFREDWLSGLDAHWVPFGTPLAKIDTSDDGVPALNNNGDGSYNSGVYSKASYAATGGLGIELRTHFTRNRQHWQAANIELVPEAFDSVAAWDHRTKEGPFQRTALEGRCEVALGGEGPFRREYGLATTGMTGHNLPLPPTMLSGGWHRIRVQVFPDGTCAFAIDGNTLWRSQAAIPTSRRFRIVLDGSSARTKMLIGPVSVWEGVKGE